MNKPILITPEEFLKREKKVIKKVKEYRKENHKENYLPELFPEPLEGKGHICSCDIYESELVFIKEEVASAVALNMSRDFENSPYGGKCMNCGKVYKYLLLKDTAKVLWCRICFAKHDFADVVEKKEITYPDQDDDSGR